MTKKTCDHCAGKGRVVLFTSVEDPCGKCGGSGQILKTSFDPTKLNKYDSLVRAVEVVGEEFGFVWGSDNIDWGLYPDEPNITEEIVEFVFDHGLDPRNGVLVMTKTPLSVVRAWDGYDSWPWKRYRRRRIEISDTVDEKGEDSWPNNALNGLYLQRDGWEAKYEENTRFPIVVWDCPEVKA